MELDQKVTKRFSADLSELYRMLQFIRDFSQNVFHDSKSCSHIELASEEALVNIIDYAYSSKNGEVMIELEGRKGQMQLVFKDHGPPFDPTKGRKKSPEMIGGKGIPLMKGTMDQVLYKRKGGVNILTLVKQNQAASIKS